MNIHQKKFFMKTKFLIGGAAIFAGAIALLSSCKREELNIGADHNAIRFTSNINLAVGTKAADGAWSANDEIGIFMVANGTSSVVDDAVNKKHTTAAGDGEFSSDASNLLYFPEDGSKVDFIAYYPYQNSIATLGDYNVNVADQSDPEAIDLLYAHSTNNNEGYDDSHTASVGLQFRHQLTKLRLNIATPDPGLGISAGELAAMTVEVSGLKTTALFDLADGTLSDLTNISTIDLRGVSPGALYDAIILPDNIPASTVSVTFKLEGKTFVWNVPAIDFESGKAYIYNIRFIQDEVEAIAVSGVMGEIVDWEDTVHEPDVSLLPEVVVPTVETVLAERINAANVSDNEASDYKTIPTQLLTTEPGDRILVYAYNDVNSAETRPTVDEEEYGYALLRTSADGSGTNGRGARVYTKTATGTSTELGAWTNTRVLAVFVFRGTQEILQEHVIPYNGSGVLAAHGNRDEGMGFPIVDFQDEPGYLFALTSTRTGNLAIDEPAYGGGFDELLHETGGNPNLIWAGISKTAITGLSPDPVGVARTLPEDLTPNMDYRLRYGNNLAYIFVSVILRPVSP